MKKVTIKATEKIQELAKEAYACQDACNLCGLAQSFAKVMIALNSHSDGCRPSQHPIAKMWIDKFCDLAGINRHDYQNDFWNQNKALMEGRDVEVEVYEF